MMMWQHLFWNAIVVIMTASSCSNQDYPAHTWSLQRAILLCQDIMQYGKHAYICVSPSLPQSTPPLGWPLPSSETLQAFASRTLMFGVQPFREKAQFPPKGELTCINVAQVAVLYPTCPLKRCATLLL